MKRLPKLQLFWSLEAIIADQMTHHRPVLLLDVRLVVFLVRAGASESHLFILTVVVQDVIDELAVIARS
jgi:hypothetical protein